MENSEEPKIELKLLPYVDELKFVDFDIAEEFKKAGCYRISTPSLVQVSRYLKKLCELMEKQNGPSTKE